MRAIANKSSTTLFVFVACILLISCQKDNSALDPSSSSEKEIIEWELTSKQWSIVDYRITSDQTNCNDPIQYDEADWLLRDQGTTIDEDTGESKDYKEEVRWQKYEVTFSGNKLNGVFYYESKITTIHDNGDTTTLDEVITDLYSSDFIYSDGHLATEFGDVLNLLAKAEDDDNRDFLVTSHSTERIELEKKIQVGDCEHILRITLE